MNSTVLKEKVLQIRTALIVFLLMPLWVYTLGPLGAVISMLAIAVFIAISSTARCPMCKDFILSRYAKVPPIYGPGVFVPKVCVNCGFVIPDKPSLE